MTKASSHGWTLDTLERYLSSKIDALDRYCSTNFTQSKERVDMALAAADKAVTKAEIATEKRFDGVNEFRGAMADQSKAFMPRAEYEVQRAAVNDALGRLDGVTTTLVERAAGKREGISGIGAILIGGATIFSSLAAAAAVVISLWHQTVQPTVQYVPAPTAIPAPVTVPR